MTQAKVTGTEPEQTYHCRAAATHHSLSFLFYRIGQSVDRQERQRSGGKGGEGSVTCIPGRLTEPEDHVNAVVL